MHAYTSEAELYPCQKGHLHFMILSMAYPRVVIPSVWPRWYTLISALSNSWTAVTLLLWSCWRPQQFKNWFHWCLDLLLMICKKWNFIYLCNDLFTPHALLVLGTHVMETVARSLYYWRIFSLWEQQWVFSFSREHTFYEATSCWILEWQYVILFL